MAFSFWQWILSSVVIVFVALLAQNSSHVPEGSSETTSSSSSDTSRNNKHNHKPAPKPPVVMDDDGSVLYVIGDLHGDAHCAQHWVKKTGVLDETTGQWRNPLHQLVFMGDYIDKGPTSKQTLEYVKSLTEQYPNHVTALMGNHEMELLLDRDERRHQVWGGIGYYQMASASVHPGEYLNFLSVDGDGDDAINHQDELVIEALYNASLEVYSHRLHRSMVVSTKEELSEKSILQFVDPKLQPLVKERMELYQRKYLNSFRSNTTLGAWLEQRPVLALIQNTLLVHGGISAGAAKAIANHPEGIHGINSQLAQQAHEDTLLEFMQGTALGQVVYNLLTFRGNHQDGACDYLPYLLPPPAVRLGVGHTPGDSVRISCQEQFLAIDSSLGRWFRNSGNQYCPGHKVVISKNGKYGCDQMNNHCEGQIVKIQGNRVHVMT